MNSLFKSTGLKAIGALSVMIALSACGGPEDIRESLSMEYLNAKTGKPVVYPVGVDAPTVSDAFAIPQLPSGNQAGSTDINDLVKPPSLLPEQQSATDDNDDEGDTTVMTDPEPESR